MVVNFPKLAIKLLIYIEEMKKDGSKENAFRILEGLNLSDEELELTKITFNKLLFQMENR